MKKLTIDSPAKVNLTLDVLPKKDKVNPSERGREDALGYGEDFHKIKTIYHKIDLHDEIEIQFSDKFEIIGEFDFPMEENLIFKAWKLIGDFVDKNDFHPVKVKIIKNIPMGGGLGGGSSNFANFVKGYFKLFDLKEVPQALINKSGEIGKDIPFFFSSARCAIGTNFGEVISDVPFDSDKFKDKTIYLYKPSFKNSTPEMFRKLKKSNTDFTNKFLIESELKNCGNTFDQFLEEKKYKYLVLNSKVIISGSGSCFFSFKPLKVKDCEIIETNL